MVKGVRVTGSRGWYLVVLGTILMVIGVAVLAFGLGKREVTVVTVTPDLQATVALQEQQSVVAQPTQVVEDTVSDVVYSTEDQPVLHHADSHAPEEGYGSFDIGVNEGQIGLVFGVHVRWPAGKLDAGGGGCDLVVLNPGWFVDLQVKDGRYEVYTLPERDHDGWITSLATLRMQEQAEHYGCPASMGHVFVWSADPHEELWRNRRRASGVDFLIPFYAGDKVYGFSIYRGDVTYIEGVGHEGDLVCDGGGCYLPSAAWDGWCGGCIVNTWWDEIPADAVPLSS